MLKSGKICKNNNHIALVHLLGPSDDVLTLGQTASCSNSFLGRANVNAGKIMCDPYILFINLPIVSLFKQAIMTSLSIFVSIQCH